MPKKETSKVLIANQWSQKAHGVSFQGLLASWKVPCNEYKSSSIDYEQLVVLLLMNDKQPTQEVLANASWLPKGKKESLIALFTRAGFMTEDEHRYVKDRQGQWLGDEGRKLSRKASRLYDRLRECIRKLRKNEIKPKDIIEVYMQHRFAKRKLLELTDMILSEQSRKSVQLNAPEVNHSTDSTRHTDAIDDSTTPADSASIETHQSGGLGASYFTSETTSTEIEGFEEATPLSPSECLHSTTPALDDSEAIHWIIHEEGSLDGDNACKQPKKKQKQAHTHIEDTNIEIKATTSVDRTIYNTSFFISACKLNDKDDTLPVFPALRKEQDNIVATLEESRYWQVLQKNYATTKFQNAVDHESGSLAYPVASRKSKRQAAITVKDIVKEAQSFTQQLPEPMATNFLYV